MKRKCWFMFDRHRFTAVEGTEEEIVQQLLELHEKDNWHGIHGHWEGWSGIKSHRSDPRKGEEHCRLAIEQSVRAAFKTMDGQTLTADQITVIAKKFGLPAVKVTQAHKEHGLDAEQIVTYLAIMGQSIQRRHPNGKAFTSDDLVRYAVRVAKGLPDD